MDDLTDISPWPSKPRASNRLIGLIQTIVASNVYLSTLAAKIEEIGIDICVITDHVILSPTTFSSLSLHEDFVCDTAILTHTVYYCTDVTLPTVLVDSEITVPTIAIRVSSIEDFVKVHQLTHIRIHGEPESDFRFTGPMLPNVPAILIQRNAGRGYAITTIPPSLDHHLQNTLNAFTHRLRSGDDLADTRHAVKVFNEAELCIGNPRAVELFFETERNYWMSRNSAGRWQKARQDAVGLGWVNHDHHTYRSSRESFQGLIQLFLRMGFRRREQFYAGTEAGWGALILDHPESRVVIFADVDLSHDEVHTHFGSTHLAPTQNLGTIGLWCALHSSAIGLAGLHHLEAEFISEKVRNDYIDHGGKVMPPFTELPVLWQAFTAAELWTVPKSRLDRLVNEGLIAQELAQHFSTMGAPGSHLEILQRWNGFKGFNKTGISAVIRSTNPRNVIPPSA